jgi:hypothetical protein
MKIVTNSRPLRLPSFIVISRFPWSFWSFFLRRGKVRALQLRNNAVGAGIAAIATDFSNMTAIACLSDLPRFPWIRLFCIYAGIHGKYLNQCMKMKDVWEVGEVSPQSQDF